MNNNASLESKALALAMLAASVSLGASLLVAIPIKRYAGAVAASAENNAAGPETQVTETPEQIAKGRENFVMSCVECHGDDATGDEGPDLHNLAISNARIATTIKHGVKGEMPSFAKKYDDAQIATLLSYIRSLK
jgi:mono/diheme cytochrome c family protein